jgi:hypothetical protein
MSKSHVTKAAASTPTKRSQSVASSPIKSSAVPRSKTPRTPQRQSASDRVVVTPSVSAVALEKKKVDEDDITAFNKARRSLDLSAKSSPTKATKESNTRKLPFGGNTKSIDIPTNVSRVYNIVNKHTGSIGGNGHGGAIYGELRVGSMQKMTNLMMEHTGLNVNSRFIDVGCGLGKPNLHVAQHPGVEFSYGIEMENVRWMLGIANLHQVLEQAKRDAVNDEEISEDAKIGHACYLAHGDITEANFFDPFTHVYMFDIG